MPFDAAGNFYRTGGGGPGGTATGADIWKGDAAANIKILASSHDIHDQDLANGLSLGILRDGRGTPVANIPWGGKKITNLADPTADQDVATKHYVDNFKAFTTGLNIGGADLNGRLNFTSPTGANGLTWTSVDMSWLARVADGGGPNRLVVNSSASGAGTDVAIITSAGALYTAGPITATSIVGAKAASGNAHFWLYGPNSEDRAVLYTAAAVQGDVTLRVGGSVNYVFSLNGTFTAPNLTTSGTVTANTVLADGITSNGNISATGGLYTSAGYFISNASNAILSASGNVYFRPNGPLSSSGQAYLTPAGDWNVPEGSVFISGGAVAGSGGSTLNEAGYMDISRPGTQAGLSFHRFLNNNGIIGSIASSDATHVAYSTSSDERLKDVIGDYAADAAIAIIRADPVKAFTWKASGERAVGWLAQRSYALDKNLAVPPEMDADGRQVDENDRWGIDYGSRTPYLWAALAAALDKIDALTARIEALEAAA